MHRSIAGSWAVRGVPRPPDRPRRLVAAVTAVVATTPRVARAGAHVPLGWVGAVGAALLCSLGPLPVQLAFAVIAIGLVGMAHGASDLAMVARPRRTAFLAWYGLVSAACLLWWVARPAIALPAFLLASAVHFGLEDAPDGTVAERAARGLSLVATPATLHGPALLAILRFAGGDDPWLPTAVRWLGLAGGAAALGLLLLGGWRRDGRLVAGTAALLLLPPLVGFSLGFLILHALPQTEERRVRLGCATTAAYLRATAPVLGAALVLAAAVGALLLRFDGSGLRALFAGIAALAVPHLLVTPWFEARAAAMPGGRPAAGPAPMAALAPFGHGART